MASTVSLQDLYALVRPELEQMNCELEGELQPASPELVPLLRHVAGYRGKQLRPALVFLTAKVCGEVTDAHYTAAKVVELIHTATLVHDDILDEATIRRQEPTLNQLHGNEVPVLLGDYLYALAFHLAVSLEDPTCARLLSEATRTVCQGEITQCMHRGDFGFDEERYYQVIREKTASLYGAACRVGVYYSGGSSAQAEALASFGDQLGVAFQIVDDCLDLSGEEAVVGKSLGSDLRLGKPTLPLLHLLKNSGPQRQRLLSLMNGKDQGDRPPLAKRLSMLRTEFDVEAAVSYSLAQARSWVEGAMEALKTLPEGPVREAMANLAEYVVRRQL